MHYIVSLSYLRCYIEYKLHQRFNLECSLNRYFMPLVTDNMEF